MDQPNLTQELLRNAQRLREPVRLAMAFKSQNPDWGSQATLVSIGVGTYLQDIDWNLSQVSTRFPGWHEAAQEHHDPHLLLLRATQIHSLAALVEQPRAIRFRLVAHATPEQRLWYLLARRGLLLQDAQSIAGCAPTDPCVLDWLPDLERDAQLGELWRRYHMNLERVQLDEYLDAVHADDQVDHPNVVFHSVIQHWRTLGRLSDPFTERNLQPVPHGQGTNLVKDESPLDRYKPGIKA